MRLTLAPWSVGNGLITPTLKRPEVGQRFAREIRERYAGHRIPGVKPATRAFRH